MGGGLKSRDLIFSTVHGSHLYGLAHEGSDRDWYEVYEGKSHKLHQSVTLGDDTVTGTLEAFLIRAASGSHQSVEAIFSQEKVWAPGMEEKWGALVSGFRVTGGDAFAKYERTIKKFCFGDFKRRRHACRLALNLADLRESGRFNPRLSESAVLLCNGYAKVLEGKDLVKALLDKSTIVC